MGLFAINFKIKRYTDNIIPRPITTVTMYIPKPAIDSKPILETMPTIKPKTANGTIFMANNRMCSVIFWTDSSMSKSGLDDSFGIAAIDSPMIKANIRILNIWPSRYEVIGFLGIMFDTAFGISSKENPSLICTSLSERLYDSCRAVISRMFPGAITDARNTATSIAIVVVITK